MLTNLCSISELFVFKWLHMIIIRGCIIVDYGVVRVEINVKPASTNMHLTFIGLPEK